MKTHSKTVKLRRAIAVAVCVGTLALACATQGPLGIEQHRWWSGLGPVLPHDEFPEDCSLCHVGEDWHSVRDDFVFDHEAETGVALQGAHMSAKCLLCHNDRGPVDVFARQGCAGCHEDIHIGTLGNRCDTCHVEQSWFPFGQVELHRKTRFPLEGVHASTSCRRCHVGAEQGRFVPTDTQCVTCHTDDLAVALNPGHVGLGWVDHCDRCHQPTTWQNAELR